MIPVDILHVINIGAIGAQIMPKVPARRNTRQNLACVRFARSVLPFECWSRNRYIKGMTKRKTGICTPAWTDINRFAWG